MVELTLDQLLGAASGGAPAWLLLRRLTTAPTAELAREILHAEALSLLRAEMELRKDDPQKWLERRDRERSLLQVTLAEALAAVDKLADLSPDQRLRVTETLIRNFLNKE